MEAQQEGSMDTAYCILCDEDPTETEPLIETPFGPMHGACYESHDEAVGEEA